MVSALSMAWPPGLSVMLSAWKRGCSASERANPRIRLLPGSDMRPREVTSPAMVTKVSKPSRSSRRGRLFHAPAAMAGLAAGFRAGI